MATRRREVRRPGAARVLSLVLLSSLAIGALDPPQALAVSLAVTVDTSALAGTSAQLAFDLIDGDGVSNNSATISGFATTGTLGAASSTGGVSGTLVPGPIIISDTAFFNELLQGITFGSSLAFTLELTTNFAGGLPDSFSFFLLNSAGTSSLVTTNLLGDALFLIDIVGSPTGNILVATSTSPSVPASVIPLAVPEPRTLVLLGLGLAALFWRGSLARLARGAQAFGSRTRLSIAPPSSHG